MTLEPVNDFFSNIKEKLTNPFFSTLIFVWLVRNWELVYTLFNFDKCYTLESKKMFITYYYSDKTIGEELFYNIGLALLLMLLGYLMLFVTRAFTTWFDFNLMPLVTKKIISNKVVQRELYDEVFKERNEYAEMYEEQRKLVRDSSKEFDKITLSYQNQSATVTDLTNKINDLNSINGNLNSDNALLKDNIANLKNDSLKLKRDNEVLVDSVGFHQISIYQYQEIIKDLSFNKTENIIPKIVKELKLKLKEDKLLEQFYFVAESLSNGGKFDASKNEKIVEYKAVYKINSTKEYKLTPIGQYLYNYWILID